MTHPEATAWEATGSVEEPRLRDALLQLHHAVQIVAAAGQTFNAPRDDDSHRATVWDRSLEALVGSGFAGPYPFRAALRPRDLTLLFLDRTDQALGALPLLGRPLSAGFEWLSLAVPTYLGGPPPRIERPGWSLPGHPVASGAVFDAGTDALAVVAELYAGAGAILGSFRIDHPGAAPVRCWPHHLDIATVLPVPTASDHGPARTIGVGMAPGGGGLDDWYWYVTPRPGPPVGELPGLPGPGRWWTDGWTGAVLARQEVLAVPPGERADLIRAFLREAVPAARVALEGA